MKFNNFFKKKGQGLPLNTVVLAILVVLVLVILIVYFTTNMTKSGNDLEQNTKAVNACEIGSYIISADDYDEVETVTPEDSCKDAFGEDWVRIYSANTGDKIDTVCCAHKKSD